MKKIDKLKSTVIIGIFLSITFIFLIALYAINVNGIVDSIASNNESTSASEGLGKGIGAAVILIMLIILVLSLSAFNIISGLICLPFAIRNSVSLCTKTRTISFIYITYISIMIIMTILKIVLVFLGVY